MIALVLSRNGISPFDCVGRNLEFSVGLLGAGPGKKK